MTQVSIVCGSKSIHTFVLFSSAGRKRGWYCRRCDGKMPSKPT